MKPKDLKAPMTWETRHVLFEDRVWYVPQHYENYEEFIFPGWEGLFDESKPVIVEYCSGNGAWIASKAQAHPEFNWVAIEMKFKRTRKIWSKIKNLRLNNLIVICGEAYTATSQYFPSGSIHDIYINFPDPWPKDRHAKHRLIKPPFVEEMRRILKEEAIVTLVTDDPDYSKEMIDCMLENPGFTPCHPDPYFVTDLGTYGSSYFDTLWRDLGRTIRYHQFRKGS